MNAKKQTTLRTGLVAVKVGSRWAAVTDYDALAVEAGRLPGSSGHRSGCWCEDAAGGWGTGRNPSQAVGACGRPVTYASLADLRRWFDIPEPLVYTVIVQDGEVVDRDLHRIRPAIVRSCGHNHKTYEAAERCRAYLRNRRREATGRWVESAAWYNSLIHEHRGDSMNYLPPEVDEEQMRAEIAAMDREQAEYDRAEHQALDADLDNPERI